MFKYVDEDDYEELLDADNIPDNFDILAIKASSYINRQTFGRIDINNIPKQVKYATCLIIDLINEEDNKLREVGNLKSQNIEGWSESYSTPEEIKSDYSNKKRNILSDILYGIKGNDGNELLYRGD